MGQLNGVTAITAVCGPAGAGKTSYVRERASWGDLIIDLDAIYTAIGGTSRHEHPPSLIPFAIEARDALMNRLALESDVEQVWIIIGVPGWRQREELRQLYGAKIVVLEIPGDECLRRIEADGDRATPPGGWPAIVKRWWNEYRADERDEVVA